MLFAGRPLNEMEVSMGKSFWKWIFGINKALEDTQRVYDVLESWSPADESSLQSLRIVVGTAGRKEKDPKPEGERPKI